ncbi:helix-turn-helix transcriptional regulator [Streptomyces smyrnaeus]|uniref:helix-turn-helix transcriptional regulator n=1 Tax=Streptomyces smyrnaeus TaxID=1387713 RepID=UPI0036C3C510
MVRRAAELSQGDIAAGVGVATSSVAGWESDNPTSPDPERFPALARALGRDLDDLFPRTGLPDLTDLRCDAGLYLKDTSGILGTKSTGPVKYAERGERRLKERYVAPLAAAYEVSEAKLLRAQERSFGNPVPEPPTDAGGQNAEGEVLPRTIAEKITYLLEHTFTPTTRPSDAEIARQGNSKAGRQLLDAALVESLRTGARAQADADVLNAVAAALDVPPLFFHSDSGAVHRIVSGVRLMKGGLSGVAARGEAEALPTELLDFINAAVEEIKAAEFPQPPADPEV